MIIEHGLQMKEGNFWQGAQGFTTRAPRWKVWRALANTAAIPDQTEAVGEDPRQQIFF